ncbi:glycosyltransferase [Halovivax sp.]|uniref:glycosyltransferase n=1 Tax=Halovivax sp. TaxID=1935978 RepID=UPI0025B7B24D|nr:glycosyltransferase [Halovivax sp.]
MTPVRTVAAFTDLYHPTVNGVTSTVATWRERWAVVRDRMPVVFPRMGDYEPDADEYPVRSVRAPLYPRYRLALPRAPEDLERPDLVHVHTPFTLGHAGIRFARKRDVPVVASYHTLLCDRADQHVPEPLVGALAATSRAYERWFFRRVDHVVAPTTFARRHLREQVGADVPVRVISNGIDTDFFRPVDGDAFRRRYDLPRGTLVGYTGRHGHEKNLAEAIGAVDGTDASLVLGGDGPARDALAERAREVDADVTFLDFLDREELPAFYSALDAFVFPSPVETQGLVALEATACGTPVVAADAGALVDSVIEGETGYRYEPGDVDAFRGALRRTLTEVDRLSDLCRRRRAMLSVEHSLEQLAALYDEVARDG